MKTTHYFIGLFLSVVLTASSNAWETEEMNKLSSHWYWNERTRNQWFFNSLGLAKRQYDSGEGSLANVEQMLRKAYTNFGYEKYRDIIENEIVALRQKDFRQSTTKAEKAERDRMSAQQMGIPIQHLKALRVVFGSNSEKWETLEEVEKASGQSTKNLSPMQRLHLNQKLAMQALGIMETYLSSPDEAKLAYWKAIYEGETKDSATQKEATSLLRDMKEELQRTRNELDELRRSVDEKP